ncbi:aminotransferase [Streptomyces sp. WAC 01325]|uniref:aminotransferase class I/II-fold pyridoxal phosphate-dependent enzyme n=1 Tax=Streptomyces sp. WAC 01325 TaxID=2203202 RepID=UPI000F89449E|nr:aminotransferase class I/II-fold pyridoxal phosphate-dependent enzyme [Streptomyces sp. WAC 01325]RSM93686.1 aminotransferase [Streptomyces sp. WAC 01325]
MPFTPFALEEWQSRYETDVAYNLADSGIDPVLLDELVDTEGKVRELLATPLHYPAVGGGDRLRELIAEQYPDAGAGNVLVTVGAAEANTLAVHTLIQPGDHAVVLEPGYRQVWGTLRNLGAQVDAFHLRADQNWRPDLAELDTVLRPDTKLVYVVNPNNPVGTVLTDAEIDAIAAACSRVGAWLIVDEVYRGTERLSDTETRTAWGTYDRVIAVGSLSKAYGLPGLRLGWLVGPQELVQASWRRHEYFTISTGILSMQLAEIALAEPTRTVLLQRTRGLIRSGWDRLSTWVASTDGLVSAHAPEATALAFIRYHFDLPSTQVADLLRTEGGVLVGAGADFGVERHLRITHGLELSYLEGALQRVEATLLSLRSRGGWAA